MRRLGQKSPGFLHVGTFTRPAVDIHGLLPDVIYDRLSSNTWEFPIMQVEIKKTNFWGENNENSVDLHETERIFHGENISMIS